MAYAIIQNYCITNFVYAFKNGCHPILTDNGNTHGLHQLLSPATTTVTHQSVRPSSNSLFPNLTSKTNSKCNRLITRIHVSSPTNKSTITTAPAYEKPTEEIVFFDSGAHYSDLLANLILGLTVQDRCAFSYKVIKDVQVVPRFIGEWGDIIITLKDGTKVDLRSDPKFREIAKYCLAMAEKGEGCAFERKWS
ncbi:NAD(P)-linked oxidoreductase superfamily protein [Quillaja saponaria]|uniref:NAD(P)-linked oxidoreductase superfamily protein n=1 Tax=Quillaja saponaria TaxID=32244 RepID=A0AAD7KPY8_QUISA|nr:NAD(P)-linked oxidoreductase superfamily protein [Quillaja saponaria]